MAIAAKDFDFEVGDKVLVDSGAWGEDEIATITAINDGPFVFEVELEFPAGDFGVYAPEQILRKVGKLKADLPPAQKKAYEAERNKFLAAPRKFIDGPENENCP